MVHERHMYVFGGFDLSKPSNELYSFSFGDRHHLVDSLGRVISLDQGRGGIDAKTKVSPHCNCFG